MTRGRPIFRGSGHITSLATLSSLSTSRHSPTRRESCLSKITAHQANHNYLIGPYLGRRRIRREPSKFISLRNYPFHVDQMEDIGLSESDMSSYARTMAVVLATLHWIGKIDRNDVEFVLAPPDGQRQEDTMSNILGEHTMWMLDFDLRRDMSMDEEGVRKAVRTYWRNHPFYPRPGKGPWKEFREQYLHTSHKICDSSDHLGLPNCLST